MTALADLEPLAVYDVRDGSYSYPHHGKVRNWAADHGINVNATYRIEIHLLDTLFARVFQHKRDEQGRKYLDPVTGEIASRTYDVPVSSMPPTGPLVAARP